MASPEDPIFVTRPYLPPLEEVIPLLQEIWASRIVTNNGPFHQLLESELAEFLEAEHLSLTANGMLALEAAIRAANLSGEVITTPYSFVATSHAVKRAQLTPIFADIKPNDLNIDPRAVEAAITARTSAIVAVHCYGNPCDVVELERLADQHGLALIYDAAHAFGVRHRGRSLLSWGDFAALSFHGTKMFNTFEGGAVVSRTREGQRSIELERNFGIDSEVSIAAVGTNAKMSEFNAALGIVQLRHFTKVRDARAIIAQRYRDALATVPGIEPLPRPEATEPNYSYFPVLVTDEYPLSRNALYEMLKERGILSRRYFYPLISNLSAYCDLASAAVERLPVANRVAEQILCLPIYPDLSEAYQDRVIEALRRH